MTLANIAAAMMCSPRRFRRALKSDQTHFSREIDRIRLNEAERRLRTAAISVTEIDYVGGFADGAHFTRCFKRRFGQSPSVYRAQLRSTPGVAIDQSASA